MVMPICGYNIEWHVLWHVKSGSACNPQGLGDKLPTTVEPVLRDHPFCHAKAVSQDRWSLVTGSGSGGYDQGIF